MQRILVVGPSPDRSKGGMATVISEIRDDQVLAEQFDITTYDSYIDGSKVKRLFYSIFAFIKFYFTKRNFDIYHIHAASRGSTFRKGHYVKVAKVWGKIITYTNSCELWHIIISWSEIIIKPFM